MILQVQICETWRLTTKPPGRLPRTGNSNPLNCCNAEKFTMNITTRVPFKHTASTMLIPLICATWWKNMILSTSITQTLNVWCIYLHEWWIFMIDVGKCAIHWVSRSVKCKVDVFGDHLFLTTKRTSFIREDRQLHMTSNLNSGGKDTPWRIHGILYIYIHMNGWCLSSHGSVMGYLFHPDGWTQKTSEKKWWSFVVNVIVLLLAIALTKLRESLSLLSSFLSCKIFFNDLFSSQKPV